MRESASGKTGPDRFANLDGLRGLAALFVMLAHLCANAVLTLRGAGGPPPGEAVSGFYALANDYVNFGRVGVILFFLISGYLIPSSLSGRDAVRHFLISRFFRLYPLFWFSLALACALQFLTAEAPSAGQVLANATMIPDMLGQARLLDVYWTLSIEFGFYGLAVVSFLLLGPMRFPIAAASAAAFLCATIAISLAQAHGTNLPLADKAYLYGVMFLGTALRTARIDARRHVLALAGLVALLAAALWGRAYIHYVLQLYGPPNAFIGLGSGLASDTLGLVLFLAGLSLSGSPPVLVRLGRVSYSLYVLHPLVITLSEWLDLSRPLAATGLYVPVLGTLALGFSILSYRWIEAPAITLGRMMRERLRQASASGGRDVAGGADLTRRDWPRSARSPG